MSDQEGEPIRDHVTRARCAEVLALLDKRFPTRAAQLREMRRLKPGADKCKTCGGKVFESKKDPRKFNCPRCRKRGSYTNDTMFSRVRCFRAWLAATAFFEAGIRINAFQFSRLLKIAYATAHALYLKLGLLIVRVQEQRADLVEVDTFQFRDAIGKSSRLTASHVKPAFEKYFDESRLTIEATSESKSTEENIQLASLATIEERNPLARPVYDFIKRQGQPFQDDVLEQFSADGKNIGAVLATLTELEMNLIIMPIEFYKVAIYDKYFIDPSLSCSCEGKKALSKRCSYHVRIAEIEKFKRAEMEKAPRKGETLPAAARRTGLAWLDDWVVRFDLPDIDADSDEKTDEESDERTDEKLDDREEVRPDEKSEVRSDEKSDVKLDEKTDKKVNLKAGEERAKEEARVKACKRKIVNRGHRYIRLLSKRHRKVSRKYTQIYLSLVWWLSDKENRKKDSFLTLCASEPSPTPKMIRDFNTPEKVVIQLPSFARVA